MTNARRIPRRNPRRTGPLTILLTLLLPLSLLGCVAVPTKSAAFVP